LPDFSSWEKTFIKVGAAIHELGHTTGISGDDATSNVPGNHITPPHEGENSTNCLMRSPSTQDTYPLIPKLCTRHNDYIRNESWIRNP